MPKNQSILLIVIACYIAPAALLWSSTYGAMVLGYLSQTAVIPIFLLLTVPVAALIVHRQAPFAYIRDIARRSLPRFAAATLIFCVGVAAFTTYKLAIPSVVPFYADHFFADLDLALHGMNPGEWAHRIVPASLQYALASLYGPVWFLLWFGLLAFMALNEDAGLRHRYFWSMALTVMLLGTVAATALSSVGPVFYDRFYPTDDRFAGLLALIAASPAGDYMAGMTDYLYRSYESGAEGLGTGISAMPSMHLAIATLNALMLTRIGRITGAIGWTYVTLILLGSVFLGWHYAIDGYVSIAVVSAIWFAVGRVLDRRTSAAPAPATASPEIPALASKAGA